MVAQGSSVNTVPRSGRHNAPGVQSVPLARGVSDKRGQAPGWVTERVRTRTGIHLDTVYFDIKALGRPVKVTPRLPFTQYQRAMRL